MRPPVQIRALITTQTFRLDAHARSVVMGRIMIVSGEPAHPSRSPLRSSWRLGAICGAAQGLFKGSELGGSFTRFEPQGISLSSRPMPRRSIWARVNCRAVRTTGQVLRLHAVGKSDPPATTLVDMCSTSSPITKERNSPYLPFS